MADDMDYEQRHEEKDILKNPNKKKNENLTRYESSE